MSPKKMHEHEIDIDVSLVKELVNAQFPEWGQLPIKRVESAGTDHVMYRLGNDLCVRLPRIIEADACIAREQAWLPKLAPLLSLAVPVPLVYGKPQGNYPCHWSVYRWIEGENAFHAPIDDNPQAAIDLAQFIHALQLIDTAGAPHSRRGVPLATLDGEVRSAMMSLQHVIDAKAVTAVWNESLAAPEWNKPPVWSHGDLLPGNVLVRNDRINAILDFSSVGIGDPACDMIPAWSIFSAKTRDIFRAHLSVDDATWMRGRGWALSIAVIALPYYQDTNPVLVAIAHRMLKEILGER